MNIRIRKKKEKSVVELCKKIRTLDGKEIWNSEVDIYKNPFNKKGNLKSKYDQDTEDDVFSEIQFNKNILKVIKKCYRDKFNIEDYAFSERIYFEEGFMYYFSNIEDFNKYGVTVREIGFYSDYNSDLVKPVSLDDKRNSINHKKCQEAVFILEDL